MINTNNIRIYRSEGYSSWQGFIDSFYNSVNFSKNYTLLKREEYVVSLFADSKAYVFDKNNGGISGFWFTLDDSIVVVIR